MAATAQLEEQVLLAREMDVDPGRAHAGAGSDVPRTCGMKTLVREGIHGSVHQALG